MNLFVPLAKLLESFSIDSSKGRVMENAPRSFSTPEGLGESGGRVQGRSQRGRGIEGSWEGQKQMKSNPQMIVDRVFGQSWSDVYDVVAQALRPSVLVLVSSSFCGLCRVQSGIRSQSYIFQLAITTDVCVRIAWWGHAPASPELRGQT